MREASTDRLPAPPLGTRLSLALLGRYVTTGSLKVTLPDGRLVMLGDGTDPVAGFTLPSLTQMLRIAACPDPAMGSVFMEGGLRMTEGELEDALALLRKNFRPFERRPFMRIIDTLMRLKFLVAQHSSIAASTRRVRHHYDLGNTLYRQFLDPEMQYSCAFWEDGVETLEEAQRQKMRITTERLHIDRPGLRVLDIGCGWGGLSRYIAQAHDAEVHGITLSKEQFAGAGDARDALPPHVATRLNYHLQDYRLHAREQAGRYDRIVSVGMFEHVGLPQYRTYFDAIRRLLTADGRAVVHTIIRPQPSYTSPWIDRHIFPGGYIPAISEMERPIEAAGLQIETLHTHEGRNYARTLAAWRDRFRANRHRLDPQRYDARFARMWEFYLGVCIHAFDATQCGLRVAQIELSRCRHTSL